tara:strand:- start:2338 stop:3279 length:942 start_codon:yes stop_codon:yes gene_type:complete
MQYKIFLIRLFIFFNFFFLLIENSLSFENKIVLKIDNIIITTIDIENEKNYLIALNPNIKKLDENRLNEIAKNSLLREKIKEKEILKYVDNIKLKQDFLDQLIKQRYSRIDLRSKDDFLDYLKNFELKIKIIEKKISIEALWNQLIYQKFYKNVKINKDKLRDEIIKKFEKDEKNFLLSEIVFKVLNKNNLKKKYSEIMDSVNKENFESAALTFSISDSSNVGGKLGWIKESSLNNTINKKLKKLKKGDVTNPILTPNGYLILKIDDIKYIKKNYDENEELNNLIKIKTNEQLNQQSIIYFNKIKKNLSINEF